MNKQFFFHGSPSNGESTATSIFDGLEEKVYKDFFSNNPTNNISPCLVCEIRRWKGKNYSVYTFYCSGRDYANRPNGYCALTLIVEEMYCRSVYELYKLMSVVYEIGLKQNLKYIDNSGRFLINSFYGKKPLDILKNDFYERLSISSFQNFENEFNISPTATPPLSFNTKDVDSEFFFETLKNDGKIFISDLIPSYNKRMEEYQSLVIKKQGLEAQIAKLSEQNKMLPKGDTGLGITHKNVPNPKQENDSLYIDNPNNGNELNNNGIKTGNLQNSNYSLITDDATDENKKLLQRILKGIERLFPIVVIILLSINTFGIFHKTPKIDNIAVLEDSTSNMSDGNHLFLKHQYDSIKNENAIYKMFTNAEICIEGISKNGEIKKGNSYKWNIKETEGHLDTKKMELKINNVIVSNPYVANVKGIEFWVLYYNGIEVKKKIVTVK